MKKIFPLLAILLLFSACQEPERGVQRLRTNIKGEPATLDPRKGGDAISSSLQFLLFEGLTRLNPDGTITPAQAQSIEISRDRKTYTFHLRETYWTDGTPVTSYDFERAWKAVLNPTFPAVNAHLLYPIKNAKQAKEGSVKPEEIGIRALDAKTLLVELAYPTPFFLDLTGFCVFFPVKQDKDPGFVSNGAFKLKEWKHDEEMILEKNPTYWQAHQIELQEIQISMVANEMTALHMYENGEIDLLDMWVSPFPIESLPELAKQGLLKSHPIAGSTLCIFNTKVFPFHNVHIRKAFAFAIDRESIVKNITQLKEAPALSVIPANLKNGRVKHFFHDADRAQARMHLEQGLKELGIALEDLQGIRYSYTTSDRGHKIAQALQQQWLETLGVQIKLDNSENKIHLDKLAKRNFLFAQTQWFAQYNDPMNFLERFKSKSNIKNYAGWEHPKFSELLEISYFENSPNKRLEILEQAEALFLDEMPATPIYHWNSAVLAQPYVKNLRVFTMGNPDFTRISLDYGKNK